MLGLSSHAGNANFGIDPGSLVDRRGRSWVYQVEERRERLKAHPREPACASVADIKIGQIA
jgi:hypothetical protein